MGCTSGRSCTQGLDLSTSSEPIVHLKFVACLCLLRGHEVTLFNRGKTPIVKIPSEKEADFSKRVAETTFIKGNRQNPEDLQKVGAQKFDVVYDMGGREASDTSPLVEMFNGKLEHFIYMSSAGV